MSPWTRILRLTPLANICFLSFACASPDAAAPTTSARRDTLPDGRVVVSYPPLPEFQDTVLADVRIGSLLAGGPDTFAEVRGIDVAPDGSIYVLDAQSSEVRVFAADGTYRATLTRRGQGPGEISNGNGLVVSPDGTFWVNDFGSRGVIHFSPDGRELARYPGLVPGFGYLWSGVVDSDGMLWERWTHLADEPAFDVTATGPVGFTGRVYFKSFDSATSAYDSVLVGVVTGLSFRAANTAGGQTVMGIPFVGETLAAIDRSRNVWTARSDEYSLTRMNADGDTVLLLNVDVPASPVTAEDIERWRDDVAAVFERVPLSVRSDIEALIPENKAILERLVIDDKDRLWVGRTVAPGEPPFYDVFDPDGIYLGSLRLFPRTYGPLAPVIRNDRVYALVLGDFDEQYVVAGRVPDFSRGR